jgi:hypothetical protein
MRAMTLALLLQKLSSSTGVMPAAINCKQV